MIGYLNELYIRKYLLLGFSKQKINEMLFMIQDISGQKTITDMKY